MHLKLVSLKIKNDQQILYTKKQGWQKHSQDYTVQPNFSDSQIGQVTFLPYMSFCVLTENY